MKDLDIKSNKIKNLHIPALTGGLNLTNLRHEAPKNSLRISKNVWQNNGILETRPGIFTQKEWLIGDGEYYDSTPAVTELTSVEYEKDGKIYRLVYKNVDIDISTQICFTSLISKDGSVFKTGQMLFLRTSDDTFYIPQKFNFFVGKPQSHSGTGIFALVKLVNCENLTQTNSKIFELSENLTTWVHVVSSYIPTVLINGRGNRYEFAKQTDQIYTGTPTRLEGLNALTSEFFSYFSSDGYSSTFMLPFSNLSNATVTARFYYSVENYVDWYIGAFQTEGTATVYNVAVKMSINREKGVVSFSTQSGEYALPLVSNRNRNNLRIFASKDTGYSPVDIADADVCLNHNGKIFLGCKNKIFSSPCENPFYFPIDSVSPIWGEDTQITALAPLEDKLLIFTKSRVYKGHISEGKNLNSYSLLADNDSIFKGPHTVDITCLDPYIGTTQKGAIIPLGKRIVFLSGDGQIYSINQSETKNISLALGNFIPQICADYSTVSAVKEKHNLIFFWDNKALCFDLLNEAWTFWEFPKTIKFSGAFPTQNGPRLIILNTESFIHFTANLKGETDIILKGNYRNSTLHEENIDCHIRTAELGLGCDNAQKSITSITLNIEGKGAEISVNDGAKTRISNIKEKDSTITLTNPVTLCRNVYMDIKGTAPLKVGSVCINFLGLNL